MNWLIPKTALQMIGRGMDYHLSELLKRVGGRTAPNAPSILNDLLEVSGKLALYAVCDGCGSFFETRSARSGSYCCLPCWAEDHGETPGEDG